MGGIMVIVPHQDDEVLLTGGLLQQAAADGAPLRVVMATNGDYGCADYSVGHARLSETLAGLAEIGIGEENVVFLGYADTGMPREESFLWKMLAEEDGEKVFRSHCSECTYGLEHKPDFHTATYGQPAAYTRNSFAADLKACIAAFQPKKIITTCAGDTHGDHSALYYFVCEALKELQGNFEKMQMEQAGEENAGDRNWNENRNEKRNENCNENWNWNETELYVGVVHSCAGDENWPLREKTDVFTCPEGLDKNGGLLWGERIAVPVPDVEKKGRMLARHVTALKPDAVEFLNSFLKEEELFWKIDWRKESGYGSKGADL